MRMYPALNVFLNCSDLLSVIVAVVGNSMVILLAFRLRNVDIRAYKWVIAAQAAGALADAVTEYLIKARYIRIGNEKQMAITGIAASLPPNGAIAMTALNEDIQVLLTVLFPIGFVYQYRNICCRRHQNSFWLVTAIVIATVVTSALIAFNSFLVISSVENIIKIPHFGYQLNVEHAIDYKTIARLVMFAVPTAVSYSVAGFCGVSTLIRISVACINETTRKMQKRFTLLISMQALLPLVFHTLPTLIGHVGLYNEMNQMDLLYVYVALNPWKNCIHPILCFIFIRPFVEALVQLLPRRHQRVHQVSMGPMNVSSIVQTTSTTPGLSTKHRVTSMMKSAPQVKLSN